MRLSDYLEPELVLIGLDSNGMEDTLLAMLEHVRQADRVRDVDDIRQAVLQRELSHTTSLGNGVALPHTTSAGVDRPLIVVATAPEGVEFAPPVVGKPADRLFFLLLSPLDAAGTHIKLLARIVRLVRSPVFVEKLLGAETIEALIAEIEREDRLHV